MGVRLSLCMIVRNEEEHLPRCLESVSGIVDEIVVVDTGSTDGTVAIAGQFGATVKQVPWQNDFAAARNESLQLATGQWVLCLDADEVLFPESRDRLPSLLADEGVEGYYVQVHNLVGAASDPETEVGVLFRIWRNRPRYRFDGAVHEQILPSIRAANPRAKIAYSPVKVAHYGYLSEHVAAKGKQNRNLALLQARLAQQPDEPFLLYNLGIEHFLQGRFDEACTAFRSALGKTALGAPWRPKLVKCYAATLSTLERWEEAFALLQDQMRHYPTYTDLFYVQGVAHSTLGQHEDAIRAFTTCLSLGPAPCPPYTSADPGAGSYKAHLALGKEYEAVDRYGEALQAYAKAAMGKPGWTEPLKWLASLMGRRVDDTAILKVLEAFFPQALDADQVKIAILLVHAGRHRLALERIAPLAEAGRLDRGGRYVLALCLAEVGRRDEALAICRENWEGSPLAEQVRELEARFEPGP